MIVLTPYGRRRTYASVRRRWCQPPSLGRNDTGDVTNDTDDVTNDP